MDKTTSNRVRAILHQGFIDARPELHDIVSPEDRDPVCSCGHGSTAHYGDMGEEDCGEQGCPCQRFTLETEETT
jgi:hypothetical protein